MAVHPAEILHKKTPKIANFILEQGEKLVESQTWSDLSSQRYECLQNPTKGVMCREIDHTAIQLCSRVAYSSTSCLNSVHNFILTFKWVHTISPWHHAVNPCWAPLPLKFRLIKSPIIHFCSSGSIVTKNKWPSSCLMSMIIILAICRGFAKHLIKTQHQAEMDSSRRHCLPLTNSLYWHSLNSLFAPLSLSVCLFLIFFFSLFHLGHFFNLSHPHRTHSSLSKPQPPPAPPPPSRSLDYVEPESGKVSLWKQGQRQRRAVDVREGKRRRKRLRTGQSWGIQEWFSHADIIEIKGREEINFLHKCVENADAHLWWMFFYP